MDSDSIIRYDMDELIEEINRHKHLFENFRSKLVFVKDFKGRYLYVNSSFISFFGLKTTMLYEKAGDIFPDSAEQVELLAGNDLRLLRGEVDLVEEIVPLKDAAGDWKNLYVNKVLLFNNKKAVGIFGIAEDVTDIKVSLEILFTELLKSRLTAQERVYFYEMSRRAKQKFSHKEIAQEIGITEEQSRGLKSSIISKLNLKENELLHESLLSAYKLFVKALINE